MATIAQAELVGVPFTRNKYLTQAGALAPFAQERLVRVVLHLDDETGDTGFHPAKRVNYAVESLPHLPLHGRIFDYALQRPTLSTALKEGASTPFVDVQATHREHGGDLVSPLKTDGFKRSVTPGSIQEARTDKNNRAVFGEEVAAALQGGRERPMKEGPRWLVEERRKKIALARQAKEQMQNQYVEFP